MKFKAIEVQIMLQVPDYEDLAYGYTSDGITIYIYFENGFLVRRNYKAGVEDQRSEYFEASYFLENVKRFYGDRVNQRLWKFFSTFHEFEPSTLL